MVAVTVIFTIAGAAVAFREVSLTSVPRPFVNPGDAFGSGPGHR